MGELLNIHPVTPQGRFIDRAADTLERDGVVVLPTDTSYSLTAIPRATAAIQRIAKIKEFDGDHKLLSLIVPDLAGISRYAKVDNSAYRILRRYLPGPYTFILPATREVPKLLGVRRKTIGVRIPNHHVMLEVAERVGGVLFSTTLKLPGDDRPLSDPDDIRERVGSKVDLILAQGFGGVEPSTMVDLCGDEPEVIREGCGDPAPFLV